MLHASTRRSLSWTLQHPEAEPADLVLFLVGFFLGGGGSHQCSFSPESFLLNSWATSSSLSTNLPNLPTARMKWQRSQGEILLTVPSLLSSPLCLCLSPPFLSSFCSDRCQLYLLRIEASPCSPATPSSSFNVNSPAPKWRKFTQRLVSDEEQHSKMQSLTLFQSLCSFQWWTPRWGLVWRNPLWVLTSQISCPVFLPSSLFFFCSSGLVLFGGSSGDDGLELLLSRTQSPDSSGVSRLPPVWKGLLGPGSQLWGSEEVSTLWSRPLGGPAAAQTQLGVEPVLCTGGVHRKRTALRREGKWCVWCVFGSAFGTGESFAGNSGFSFCYSRVPFIPVQ